MFHKKVFLLVTILLTIFGGCNREEKPKSPASTFDIKKEYKRGPVTFLVEVDKKEISIADHLSLVIKVFAQEDYEVQLPKFGDKLERFGIVDYHTPSPKLADNGKVLYLKSYKLEPFLSGVYKIPPMKIVFWQKSESKDKKHELESEELSITVTSLLPEKTKKLTILEIMPPEELPGSTKPWLIGGIGAVLLCVAGVFALVLWRKRRNGKETVTCQSAHEIAFEALQALLSENLVEKGEVKLFYMRLSNVLRHYIENRFSLRAPERTTEEFLWELRSSSALIPPHKEILKGFLKHCDVVKFAAFQPGNEDIQQTFDACKLFINETETQPESKF